jgi:glyoxalase family protein
MTYTDRMSIVVKGIHHITAISSDPQATYFFYSHILGLRLVKKSVNQDDVRTYHLFFGDKTGEPGMDVTFFTFQPVHDGERGLGQVTKISFAVPEKSLDFWQKRFVEYKVRHEKTTEFFGKKTLVFYDQDDQRLELVAVPDKELKMTHGSPWETPQVTAQSAIRCFYTANLTVPSLGLIEPVLVKVLGYQIAGEENGLTLFEIKDSSRAKYVQVEESPEAEMGVSGAGTVHHIAFEVADEEELLKMRERILEIGLYPTEVINRFYFKSVYFRTPPGILFELATSGPGFIVDEDEAELGEKLALPPFLEPYRKEIEANLTPITMEK